MTNKKHDSNDVHSTGVTRLPHRRTDWYSARMIEQGVALQAKQGTQAAAAFLKSNSIVADITIRTLLHPDQRRSS